MISASYRNFNSYSNRNSPSNRQSRHHSQRGTTSSTNSNSASSNADFIYKGANKHHWAKLQSKIKQKLMHENISYIEDEAEVARRSVPPPPAIFLAPPAFLETAQDREERLRQQKLLDEARKKREDKYEEYQDDFAKDFPKGISAHYAFLQESIVTDLERAIQNIIPPTTNVMTQYRVMKDRLLNKFGPNSQKDAEETRRKLENLHGDHRGWDVYLAALDSLVEVLAKTPVRDTANNPVMEPVPTRPHLPVPPPTAPQADFAVYAINDANAQQAWEVLHPNDRTMNHRPTDTAIKNTVMLALGTSAFPPYSILAQRYRQTDHANKTWLDLRQDIELIIANNPTGTSHDPTFRHRDRNPREWRQSSSSQGPHLADSRASRTFYDAYHDAPATRTNSHGKRLPESTHNAPQDVRAATPTSASLSPGTKNPFPCSNCGGDHRAQECDNPKCFICQTVFPNPAARQAHYLSIHKRDTKRARFGQDQPRGHYTPPTSPFLSRSAEDMNNPSPYDSGYDSTYSNASGPGHPPSSRGNSDMDEQVDRYIRDQRVATLIVEGKPPNRPPPTTPATPAQLRDAAQHHRSIATYHQLLASNPRTTPPIPHVQLIPRFDMSYEDHLHPSRHVPTEHITSGLHNHARQQRTPNIPPDPTPSDGDEQSSTSSSMPSLIDASSDEDNFYNRNPAIADDARNAINRRYTQMQTQPPEAPPGDQPPYDIRVATYDSDSTHTPIYPDDSDEENTALYWPERTASSPPRTPDPNPTVLSTVNLTQWSTSQQPWHRFRMNLYDLCDLPDEECPAPTLHRTMPNHHYLFNTQDPSPDTIPTDNRILGWAHSNLSWTEYLNCLPPIIRRHYLNMPPTPADLTANNCLTRSNTRRLGGYPQNQDPTHTDDNGRDNERPAPNLRRSGGYRQSSQKLSSASSSQPRKHSRDSPPSDNGPNSRHAAQQPTQNTKRTRTDSSSSSSAPAPAPPTDHGPLHRHVRPHKAPTQHSQPDTHAQGKQPAQQATDSAPAPQRPRFPGEHKSLPDLNSAQMELARAQLNANIQRWYENNPTHPRTIRHLSPKDPAEQHPDDQPRTIAQATPSTSSTQSTSHRLGGYSLLTSTSSAPRNTPLKSILKNHTQPAIQQKSPPSPAPQYQFQFQPITQPANHAAPPKPAVPAPRQRDTIGSPWCDCCTAQLSDDDTTHPGLRDPSSCRTRYRLRQENDNFPTHSNQHSDFIRIFRANAKYHDVQREAKEIYQARTGILPDHQATSTFANTPDVANLAPTMGSLQYTRYRARGGRRTRGPHEFDHEHNSPNVLNMAPGEPYRQWFHTHISHNHYSLGEATEIYNEWVVHPQFGPAPPPPPYYNNPSTTYAPTPDTPPPPTQPSTPDDHSDSSEHNSPATPPIPTSHRHARAQTIVQDVHTSPDDSNAVLDSGAMMTTAPRRLLMTNPEWENNIRPAPPGTAIRYGNMETEPVEETSHIGSYPLSIVPNRYRTALV